jgi:hypothetical protein
VWPADTVPGIPPALPAEGPPESAQPTSQQLLENVIKAENTRKELKRKELFRLQTISDIEGPESLKDKDIWNPNFLTGAEPSKKKVKKMVDTLEAPGPGISKETAAQTLIDIIDRNPAIKEWLEKERSRIEAAQVPRIEGIAQFLLDIDKARAQGRLPEETAPPYIPDPEAEVATPAQAIFRQFPTGGSVAAGAGGGGGETGDPGVAAAAASLRALPPPPSTPAIPPAGYAPGLLDLIRNLPQLRASLQAPYIYLGGDPIRKVPKWPPYIQRHNLTGGRANRGQDIFLP